MESHVFRERDIRGKYPDEVNENLFRSIGNAFARTAENIIVARDARLSSPALKSAFINGAADMARSVTDADLVPQACAISFAAEYGCELAYITGSHLARDFNGVKFFHSSGQAYSGEEMKSIYKIIGKYEKRTEKKAVRNVEPSTVINSYIEKIIAKLKSSRRLRVLIDCGNGVNGMVAESLFRKAGFDTKLIFGEPDGRFPNRNPDPKEDPLYELRKKVVDYDIGIAYDADGDRFFAVSNDGKVLTTGQMAYILLLGIKKPGDVVANVEVGRAIDSIALEFGRSVVRVPVGVKDMEEAVLRNKAVLGIESSHHCFIPDVSKFSDAVAASLFFCKAVAESGRALTDLMPSIISYPAVRINFECDDTKKFDVVKKIAKKIREDYAAITNKITAMDGIRVDMQNGWFLVRPSQTEGIIRLTIEGDSEEHLKSIRSSIEPAIRRIIDNC